MKKIVSILMIHGISANAQCFQGYKIAKENIRKIILLFVLILVITASSCSEHKSTLTVKNWPFTGSGKLVVYIYENLMVSDESTNQKDEVKKLSEFMQDEILLNPLKIESKSKMVARYFSVSLASPFKLITDDGKIDWTGNGTYTVKIYVPDDMIKNIVKNDVVFSNGSATIDFNEMTIIPHNPAL